MADIVVRYEPSAHFLPHVITNVESGRKRSFATFHQARRRAKALNGGRLPLVESPAYGRMFRDRIRVWTDWDCPWFSDRGLEAAGDLDGYPTHAAAMTAAHKLAKGVGV